MEIEKVPEAKKTPRLEKKSASKGRTQKQEEKVEKKPKAEKVK